MSLPIVAAYRVFLDKQYNWVLSFDEFAEEFITQCWEVYYRKYLVTEKLAGNTISNTICRNQDIWENLYSSAQSYLNKHLMKLVKSRQISPEQPKEYLTLNPM